MKLRFRLLLALLIIGFCAGSAFGELQSRGECEIGGILTVDVVASYRLPVALLELRDAYGDVLSANVPFGLPGSTGSLHAVLGIPDSLDEGSYTLAAIGLDGTVLDSRQIAVHSRVFRRETIRLNGTMSELRRLDSERRFEEAKQLKQLLGLSNRDALHHFGGFRVPVDEVRITSHFGDRRLFVYIDGTSARSVHWGVDFAGPEGTPVMSSGRGVVAFAGNRLITGNTVVIEHLPGVYSLYYHLADISVARGYFVTEKSVIGTIGSTGLATGPHLHWEIRVGGIGVDPMLMTDFSLLQF